MFKGVNLNNIFHEKYRHPNILYGVLGFFSIDTTTIEVMLKL